MSSNLGLDEEELTPDEIAELQEELKKIFGEEVTTQASVSKQSNEMVFFQEPMLLDESESIEYMKNQKFTEGFEYGLRLAGIYTALVSFGVEVGTANDIVANEHTKFVNMDTQKVINEGHKAQALKIEKSQL